MKHLKTYKIFERYDDNEYIDTDVLLDVLHDINIEHDIDVQINTTLYDPRPDRKFNIGSGYLTSWRPNGRSEFGVYEFKFIFGVNVIEPDMGFNNPSPNSTQHLGNYIINKKRIILDLIKRSLEYYKEQSGQDIIAFSKRDEGEWDSDSCEMEQTDAGDYYFIRVYFSRSEVERYALPMFYKRYEMVK